MVYVLFYCDDPERWIAGVFQTRTGAEQEAVRLAGLGFDSLHVVEEVVRS